MQDKEASPTFTEEQTEVIHYKGSRLVVKAYAGTGKTTVLVQYAKQNPRSRMLYLAYNRAIRDEAVERFPANVDCKTSHQLAYAAIGKDYAHKLSGNLRLTDIAQALNTRNWTLARDVQDTLNAFLCSSDTRVLADHFPRASNLRSATTQQSRNLNAVVEGAQHLWSRMTDPKDPLPATHDAYLKLYQLSAPQLSLRYDTILFDEAQDANPVTSAIVLQQQGRLILVGDSHQQIYRWRGADNAMDAPALAHADRLYLTHSFRFGPRVALVANALLEFKGEMRPVIGRGEDDQVVMKLPADLPHRAILHRTVMGVLMTALEAASLGVSLFWVGGIDGYQVSELEDLYWFARGVHERVRNKRLLAEYAGFQEYQDIAEATRDPEMCRAIAILKKYDNIPQLIAHLRRHTVSDERDAALTVSTAHRCKGLEWDYVALADDFPNLFDPELRQQQRDDEANLLYVASTRARRILALNSAVSMVLHYITQKRQNEAVSQKEKGDSADRLPA